MLLARVIGTVVATRKDERLVSSKLLIAHPVNPAGEFTGNPLVAVDTVDAGAGAVFFVRGREASFPFLPAETPVDACVVGIVDSWHTEAPVD